jgi:hypothetical protein
MQIPKDMILKMLMDRGQGDQATQADQELPSQVDTDQHAGLLSKFGLDIGDVMRLAGGGGGGEGGGGPLGGIGKKLGL